MELSAEYAHPQYGGTVMTSDAATERIYLLGPHLGRCRVAGGATSVSVDRVRVADGRAAGPLLVQLSGPGSAMVSTQLTYRRTKYRRASGEPIFIAPEVELR